MRRAAFLAAFLVTAGAQADEYQWPVEWQYRVQVTEVYGPEVGFWPIEIGETFGGRFYWDPRDPVQWSDDRRPCDEIHSWGDWDLEGTHPLEPCMGITGVDQSGIALDQVDWFSGEWYVGGRFSMEHWFPAAGDWYQWYIAGEIIEVSERRHNPFRRGDCNADGELDISDPLRTLLYLFAGREEPGCPDACDVNDDGELDISDAIASLARLFTGGPEPSAPYRECGEDPTWDELGCAGGCA